MSPRDIFGLFIRVVGLCAVILGAHYVMSAAEVGFSPPDIPHSSVASYLIYGLVYVVIGMFMLRKADAVTSYSYPSAPGGLSPGGNDEEPSTRV